MWRPAGMHAARRGRGGGQVMVPHDSERLWADRETRVRRLCEGVALWAKSADVASEPA